MPAPNPLPKYVYKILPSAPPSPIPDTLPLSDLDKKDGFIHLSTSAQVPKTADLFFAGLTSIWLLKVPLSKFDEKSVKWEDAGDSNFPHLYDTNFGAAEVEDVAEFKRTDGIWSEVFAGSEWLV